MRWQGFAPQLVNLEDDPDEYADLGQEPRFSCERQRLNERLHAWLNDQHPRLTMADAEVAQRTIGPRSTASTTALGKALPNAPLGHPNMKTMDRALNCFGGRWTAGALAAGGGINPATDEVAAQFSEAMLAETLPAIEAARMAFDAGPWSRTRHPRSASRRWIA